ncbi:regulatory protein RecX [Sphingobacterium wenxiniae]|uniref:Regulatory protein RecX n=1 Tax=Sphingobacterium wenxiniae TaxID=683125 RepID=A0A1I6QLC3_9SPHI|nr:regulatory protein RecX [Sphingobacterium wenxiniae]SFS53251.1 regulatory protein [Sphingobacterium wenxiniae]
MEENKVQKKKLTPQQAQLKAESYCAYQERAQQEVRNKLYDWGLHQADVENIISELITGNFLNEERFAKAYAQGKFRMKGWGKIKIKQGLKFKQVSDPLIKLALSSINPEEYYEKLTEVLERKNQQLQENDPFKRRHKLIQYAFGRGFEQSLIWEILADKSLAED